MWATSSRCGKRRPQAEVGTQTDPPTPPVSPARAPAAPPTHHLTQTEEEQLLTHAQRERWADYRRRERLEARWHEQAAERGVVAHTTAPTAHRSAQRAVQEATRREELRRRGGLPWIEADDHCEYEEYPPCENRRGRSRSRSEARRD